MAGIFHAILQNTQSCHFRKLQSPPFQPVIRYCNVHICSLLILVNYVLSSSSSQVQVQVLYWHIYIIKYKWRGIYHINIQSVTIITEITWIILSLYIYIYIYANWARSHGWFMSPWVQIWNNETWQGAMIVQRSTKMYACTYSDRMIAHHHTSISCEPLWSDF